MNPDSWAEMVKRTRELEAALGSADKMVADNEKETVVIQRRCLEQLEIFPKVKLLPENWWMCCVPHDDWSHQTVRNRGCNWNEIDERSSHRQRNPLDRSYKSLMY